MDYQEDSPVRLYRPFPYSYKYGVPMWNVPYAPHVKQLNYGVRRRKVAYFPHVTGDFFLELYMLDQFLDINMSLDYIRSNYLVCLGIFWHVAAVILGGLVIWSGFILRRSTPRRGRR